MRAKLLLLVISIASMYTSVNAQYCSGTTILTSSSGSFSDGSGSSTYTTYSNCSWLIQPTNGGTITLSFSSFSTESGFDYVKVYNGSTTSSTLLGTFSGSSLPSSVTSTGSSMLVVFTTDGSSNYSGWDASYTTGSSNYCTGTTYLTSSSGTFSDGSGSSNYLNSSNCSWLIQPTSGGVITLSFSSFFTESSFDVVRVYNGSSTSSTLLGTFSGSSIPSSVTSTGSSMLVVFTTDGSSTYSGWDASYTTGSVQQYCTGTTYLTSPSGTFSDGSGTSNYLNSSNCSWLIQPSTGGVVTLSFNSFYTEGGFDYVKVYDGTSTSATLLGSYSGSSLPASVTSTGSAMYVVFTSDGSSAFSGWDASYTSCSLPVPTISYTGSLTYCTTTISKTLTTPVVSGYSYTWYKNNNLISGATSNSYTATDFGSYTVLVKQASTGCTKLSAPVVIASSKLVVNITSPSLSACTGGKVQLNASVINGVKIEDFSNFNTANWTVVGGTVLSSSCGFTTNAMFFDGSSTRYIQSNFMDLTNATSVSFNIAISNGTYSSCETVDSGEEIVLQYSTNGGSTWNTIQTYYPSSTYQVINEPLPSAAKFNNVAVRLYQLSNSGTGYDNWAVDDLGISAPSTSNTFSYSWSPTTNLSNATIANPLATISSQTTYTVTATDLVSGCTGNTSTTLTINNTNIPVTISSTQKTICAGGTTQLSTSISSSSAFDDFESTNSSLWVLNTGGLYTQTCGSYSGNAMLFYSSDLVRSLTSKPFNTTSGGTIRFYLKMPNSSSLIYCENPDSGEEVILEYSTDNVNWNIINTYYNTGYPNFTLVNETLPTAAYGANVSFRWRQPSNSGYDYDYWGLDNVQFTFGSSGGTYSYSWTPTSTLSSPTKNVTTAAPTATTTYTLLVTDLVSNCNGAAVTIVNVGGGVAPTPPVVTKNGNTLTSSYSTGNQWYLNGALVQGATGSSYSILTPTPGIDNSYAVEYTGTNGCSSISNPYLILNVEEGASYNTSMDIYPNPFESSFTLKLNSNSYRNIDVKITDVNGSVLMVKSIPSGSDEYLIPTDELSKGVYFVKITNGENTLVKKVIKQ